MRDIDHRVIVAASPTGDKEGRIGNIVQPLYEAALDRMEAFFGVNDRASGTWRAGSSDFAIDRPGSWSRRSNGSARRPPGA